MITAAQSCELVYLGVTPKLPDSRIGSIGVSGLLEELPL